MHCTKNPVILPTELAEIDVPTPRINLSTSEDVRREMARVYREATLYLVKQINRFMLQVKSLCGFCNI